MKKILGTILLLVLIVVLLSVAAIPAMFWLDNWFQVLSAVTVYLALIGVMTMFFAKYLTYVLDALIKKGDKENEK